MLTKKCTGCLEDKTLDNFTSSPRGLHGKKPKCKACVKIYNSKYSTERTRTDEAFRLKNIERAKQWVKENPEKRAIIAARRNQRQKEKAPEKVKARALVNQRVRFGRMPKASELICSVCSSQQAAHYHHHRGYAFEHRYDVVPVCHECHVLVG